MEKIGEFLKQYWMFVVVGVIGVGIVGYGLWGAMRGEQASVEIVKSNSQITNSQILKSGDNMQIVVDVAGAVEKPGVYKMPSGSRIGDALVSAGGLSAEADREWVAKTLNLAEEVKDGGKVYIPSRDENNNQAPNSNNQTSSNVQNSKLININTASVGELDSLPEIGEARAKAIIANRPYGSSAELVSKAKIPASVYAKIKDLVSIY
ncbi:hypothetical protein COT54_01170 [Candidatus Collierbacteria bacterium CG09_land_8_20_14_0_10_46_12]|uniref:Soluble ligand binding domain-containing protein n=2 Tax=Candidatus Collieribacteriota TaxID=1752725 RepID=A0A2H0WZK4_9BACT|nr:MAG: hypothetical protein COT54_01170 [Candidatus Collierbacteria bacterium CG09_land_8_20_14_0_10_46_12]